MNWNERLLAIGLTAVVWSIACTGGTLPVTVAGGDDEAGDGSPPLAASQVIHPLPPDGTKPKMSSAQASSGSGSGSPVGSVTSSTGSGGGCTKCNDVLTGSKMASNFCSGSSALFTSLFACACPSMGGCKSACGTTCTAGTPPTTGCQECTTTLCPSQVQKCAADM